MKIHRQIFEWMVTSKCHKEHFLHRRVLFYYYYICLLLLLCWLVHYYHFDCFLVLLACSYYCSFCSFLPFVFDSFRLLFFLLLFLHSLRCATFHLFLSFVCLYHLCLCRCCCFYSLSCAALLFAFILFALEYFSCCCCL